MNTSAERAQAAIKRRGVEVSIRRMSSTLPQTVVAQADVKGMFGHAGPEKTLVVGVTYGTRSLIISALDLAAAGFPVPVVKGDRIYLSDKPTTIDHVDEQHREWQGCIEIRLTGV